MDNVLGHDIDGRPLRVGDDVVLVDPRKASWAPYKGKLFTVRGIDPDNGWMVTVNELPDPYATNPARVRKLHNDHRPADESFEDMMNNLKSPEKMGEMR